MLCHLSPGGKDDAGGHLAAIRMLFDWLVTGQVMPTNPAHAVRGPKHSVKKGKTSVLSAEEMGQLLASIDAGTLIGLRDRAPPLYIDLVVCVSPPTVRSHLCIRFLLRDALA